MWGYFLLSYPLLLERELTPPLLHTHKKITVINSACHISWVRALTSRTTITLYFFIHFLFCIPTMNKQTGVSLKYSSKFLRRIRGFLFSSQHRETLAQHQQLPIIPISIISSVTSCVKDLHNKLKQFSSLTITFLNLDFHTSLQNHTSLKMILLTQFMTISCFQFTGEKNRFHSLNLGICPTGSSQNRLCSVLHRIIIFPLSQPAHFIFRNVATLNVRSWIWGRESFAVVELHIVTVEHVYRMKTGPTVCRQVTKRKKTK